MRGAVVSLPRYPEYRDSGLPWLGSVPQHWTFAPLWVLFNRTKRTGFEGEQLLSVYRDHGVIPKASRDDNNNKPSDDLSPYQLVCPGDLAINKMKAWQGSVAISEHRGIVSPAYFVYEAKHQESSRYLHYLMRSPQYVAGYLSMSKGIRINQWDLESQYHSRLPVLIPPKEEQERVATFLDRETAKIDALVAEQEKLLALLAEKRQATISHAITRGLNPNAAMKDSGIPWLGEVPAHWNLCRLKDLSVFTTSGPRGWSDHISESGSLFVQSGDLDDELAVDFVNAKRVTVGEDAEAARTRLVDGDIVICITGAKTGNVAVCSVVPEPAFVNQHLCLVRPSEEVNSRFFGLALKSGIGQAQLDLSQYGLKRGLSLEKIRDLLIVLPPRSEQEAIVAHIDNACDRLLALRNESERAIDLFKERRSTLISAAVTGKIDVRHAA
jgi:type I restriction enzyme S subunit